MKKVTFATLGTLCLATALAVSPIPYAHAQDRPEAGSNCVNGICYPDPLTVTISVPNTATLVQILAQQHIPDTEANRTIFVNGIVSAYLAARAPLPLPASN